MKFKHLLAMMAFIFASMIASVSQAAGNISGITVPASAVVGTPVSITVTGTGTCESGFTISWGDGTADSVVPGTVALPHSPPSHTYTTTGNKTISLDAVDGDCSGSPSTSINITAAPAPSVDITSITGNSCAVKGSSYKIKVNGTGTCATLDVNWGDGTSDSYTSHNLAASPWRSHTYSALGSRTINASGTGCGGKTKTITVKNSCGGGVVIPDLRWIVKFRPWPWFVPPKGPGPVCLSCPNWLKKIRTQEKYQKGLVRQLKKYQGMAKGGKRLSKGQMRHMQQLRKNLQRSEGQRQRLIRSHKRAFNKRGAMKKGTMPRRGMQRKMAPGVQRQMK